MKTIKSNQTELTALERDEQVARWVELSAARISRQPDEKTARGRPKGGVNSAAKEIGVSEPDARRAVKVAKLSDEAKAAAREVGLDDNRTALLEAAANRRLADEYDAARERGEVVGPSGGGDSTVPVRNAATAAEVGFTRKQIHEAREIRDAEVAQPGIVGSGFACALRRNTPPPFDIQSK